MSQEQENAIVAQLTAKFPFFQGKTRIQRDRRIWAETTPDHLTEVVDYLFGQAGFPVLCSVVGLDLGATFGAVYVLAQDKGIVLNLTVILPKDQPILDTITKHYPPADLYEREMVDLLGFQVRGLPPGHRYPLPDGWPEGQYPLRKGWKGLPGEEPATQEVENA